MPNYNILLSLTMLTCAATPMEATTEQSETTVCLTLKQSTETEMTFGVDLVEYLFYQTTNLFLED